MNTAQIDKNWRLFKTVIAASTADYERTRTPYFFKREAIIWMNHACQPSRSPLPPDACVRLSKAYVQRLREVRRRGTR